MKLVEMKGIYRIVGVWNAATTRNPNSALETF
jgi:hypothetical protein